MGLRLIFGFPTVVAGCTIVPWRRSDRPSHNPNGFLVRQLVRERPLHVISIVLWRRSSGSRHNQIVVFEAVTLLNKK